MRIVRTGICGVLVGLVGLGATGCFPQALSDLVNAGLKISNDQLSDLSANEIKTLNEVAIGILNEANGTNLQPITDTQAQAVADFFQANNIDSVDDLDQLEQQAQNDPGSIQGLDALAAAFAGTETDIDPNNVDPNELDQLFNSIFTGNTP